MRAAIVAAALLCVGGSAGAQPACDEHALLGAGGIPACRPLPKPIPPLATDPGIIQNNQSATVPAGDTAYLRPMCWDHVIPTGLPDTDGWPARVTHDGYVCVAADKPSKKAGDQTAHAADPTTDGSASSTPQLLSAPYAFVIGDNAQQPILTINTETRKITVPDGVEINDAARQLFKILADTYLPQCRPMKGAT